MGQQCCTGGRLESQQILTSEADKVHHKYLQNIFDPDQISDTADDSSLRSSKKKHKYKEDGED